MNPTEIKPKVKRVRKPKVKKDDDEDEAPMTVAERRAYCNGLINDLDKHLFSAFGANTILKDAFKR